MQKKTVIIRENITHSQKATAAHSAEIDRAQETLDRLLHHKPRI
jgi:hypothetical protein